MALTEEALYDAKGVLLTDSTWNYKIPSATCIPRELHVQLLEVRSGRRNESVMPYNNVLYRTRTIRGVCTAARPVESPLCSFLRP